MDISQLIYNIAGGLDENRLIFGVFLVVLVLFLLGTFHVMPRAIAASLMISVGIFGTFLGVFIALYPLEFTPEKINDSIEELLRGMRTAFVTSLIGIAGAVASRFLWHNIVMDNIEKRVRRLFRREEVRSPEHKDISSKLEEIKQAIAGNGDGSLVTQMQKQRGENRDGFAQLNKRMEGLADAIKGELVASLEDLIKQIREIIAEQLTDALKDLIVKIETALIEQFGKTFVEFNQGVQAIKKWQEDHRKHVEEMTAAFNQATSGMTDISSSMRDIKESAAAIPPSVEKLSDLVRLANEQIEELDRRLKAFSDMKEKAETAFPAIETRLSEIGDKLAKSVEGIESMRGTIQEIADQSKTAAADITSACAKEIEQVLQNMRSSMENTQKDAADKMRQTVDDNVDKIRAEAKREIESIAQEYADNLVAIAKKCSEVIRTVEHRGR